MKNQLTIEFPAPTPTPGPPQFPTGRYHLKTFATGVVVWDNKSQLLGKTLRGLGGGMTLLQHPGAARPRWAFNVHLTDELVTECCSAHFWPIGQDGHARCLACKEMSRIVGTEP